MYIIIFHFEKPKHKQKTRKRCDGEETPSLQNLLVATSRKEQWLHYPRSKGPAWPIALCCTNDFEFRNESPFSRDDHCPAIHRLPAYGIYLFRGILSPSIPTNCWIYQQLHGKPTGDWKQIGAWVYPLICWIFSPPRIITEPFGASSQIISGYVGLATYPCYN